MGVMGGVKGLGFGRLADTVQANDRAPHTQERATMYEPSLRQFMPSAPLLTIHEGRAAYAYPPQHA